MNFGRKMVYSMMNPMKVKKRIASFYRRLMSPDNSTWGMRWIIHFKIFSFVIREWKGIMCFGCPERIMRVLRHR